MAAYEDSVYDAYLKGVRPEPAPVSKKKEPGAASDMWSSFASGAGNLVQGVGTFFGGSDSALAEAGGSAQEYWDERKSSKLRAKEAELSRKMRDKDVGFLETVGSVITDPYLASSMVAGSAPSMAVGMGAGGLVARGMAAAGLMTAESGALTSLGSRIAGGVGEGLTLVPDVYQNSGGSGVASAAGLGLGIITNVLTPGNIAGSAAAKLSGRALEDTVENAFNKSVARRVGTAIAGESAQEFGQEGGQAAIEQLGRGEQLDWNSIAKQGGVGAALGGIMGAGMHPVVGEGAPKFKTQEERDAALATPPEPVPPPTPEEQRAQEFEGRRTTARDAARAVLREQELIQLNERIAVVQAQADANPTDPVPKAELETLKATQQVNAAAGNLEANPTPENQQAHDLAIEQQQVASATLASAKDPANRDAYDTAETMRAALALKLAGPDGVKHAADVAAQASTAAIAAAPDLDNALGAFSSANQASSTLRVSTTGMQNTVAGVAQAGEEVLASHTVDVAAAEADLARTQHEAKLRQHKEQQAAHKTQQAALKVDQERAKLGLPTINADMVPEATGAVEPTAPAPAVPARMDAAENVLIARLGPEAAKQVFRSFTAMPTPDLQNLLRIGDRNGAMEADAREYLHALVESRGETVEGSGSQAQADTQSQSAAFDMQRDGIQGREVSHTRVPNGNPAFQYAVGRTTEQGIDTVFRRRADEAGTYGGWRWETELSRLLPESQATAEPAPAASPGAPAELAATEQAMLDDGYGQVAVRGMYNLANQDLIDITNDIGAQRSKREHAFEILQNRQNQYIMNRAQFNARENALENALAALAQVSGRTVDQITTMIAAANNQALNNIINNPSAQYRNEQQALARIAVAYKNNTHLGNVDQFITTARRTAPQPEPSRAPAAAPAAPTPAVQGGRRRVEENFETRARTALNNGVLDKLGTFWNNVMRGRGQRVFNVNTRDLAGIAQGFGDLTQAQLNTLRDRYNTELNRQARQWALDNNQPIPGVMIDPVIRLIRGGSRIQIEVRALGRNGANPYMVPPAQSRDVGMATISTSDGHMTTTGLEDAPGSSNLGYRLGAEIARMAGENVPASDTLLTNNRMRRHMQSVYADSLFGPGHVSPMNAHGGMTPQGVPARVWGAANDVQRVGLNMMRAAHSITEGRSEGVRTAANFTENLQYNREGKIIAVTEPKHARGWPVGTEVTDAMLLARLREVDPVSNASAMGRTSAGGVGVDTAKLGIMTNTILAAIEANPTRAIPSWMLPKAKQIGRDIGGWMFSEAETTDTAATGVTQEQAEAEVRNMVGDNAAKVLLESGAVSFVESGEELTGDTFSDKNGKVQGATMPDGKIVLVLGNLNEETLGPVLAHEALHSTLRNLLGEDTYRALMSRLDTMLKAGEGSQWVKDAEARVPPNTAPEQRLEEIAAYAVELEVKGGTRGNPLVRWARDFMSALRTAIIQNKALPEALRMWAMKNIQPQDLTRLAVAGLKRAAVGEGAGIRMSERDYAAEQAALLEEHRAPGTTNERRSAINTEIAKLRTAQRVRDDANFEMESSRNPRYSVAQEAAALEAPVAQELPGTFNVLDIGRRGGAGRALERLRSAIQDKHVTLRRIQQLAKIGAENIRMDTIGALDRLGSKLMAEQKRLVDEPLAKMENLLDKAGFTPDEGRAALDRLLIAAHVKEYNEHIAEINPVKFDAQGNYVSGFDNDQHPGSGITSAEAAETLRELTSGNDPKTLALLAAQKEYRKMIADMQAFAVDRGLETQETIDSWNKKFPNYTPFNRELDIQENLSIGTVPGSQGFSLRSGIARRAMGSGAEIISPLASTMLWGLKTTTRGENAIVARTFLEFAKAFVPNYMSANGELRPMWKVNTVPNARVVKKMNVYRVSLPEGGLSPEFYSREQAENFGTMQQRAWQAANPGVSPRLSGINVEHMYDGEPQNRVVVQPEPNYQNKPNVMIVPVDGENQMIEFDSHSKDAMAIVEAFKGKATSGAATQTMNKVLTPFRMFSRWVMATSTGFNPVFAFFNAARDVQAAAINAGADKIPGWTAGDSAKIATGLPAAWHGIAKQLRAEFDQMHNNVEAPAPVAGSSADWMQRMVAAGGATGIAHSVTDVEAAETQLRRLFGQAAVDRMTGQDVPNDWLSRMDRALVKVGDSFHRLGEGETRAKGGAWVSKQVLARIGRFNQSAELATRTLVFKRATELYLKGGHDLETAEKMAADISKNISTNFNRRGNFTNVINQLVPFFNAAMQGTSRLAETLFVKETYEVTKGDKLMLDQRTKLTPYGKAVIGTLASLGALQSMLLLAAGYDDDEVPKHVKDRAFVIPGLNGSYFAIPMPHGFNLLVNGGRELSDALVQGAMGNGRKALSHLADGTWGQIGALNPLGNAGNTVTDLLPAIADPFVSIAMNQDAFGRPIAKEDLNPMAPTPGFKRAKEGATGFSKVVAEGLNWMTLGDQDRPGMLSPTPDQIDFLMGYIGGGVGREVAKSMQTGTALAQDALGIEREQLPTNRVPLLGRLYGDTTEPMVTSQKVFNVTKELNILQAQYKGMMERGEKEEAKAFRAEHPELALQDDFSKFSRGNSKVKKERVKLRETDEVGKINEVAGKRETKAQELLRRYEELLPN